MLLRHGHVDSGWLFIIVGLSMCASALLIPAQRDLDRVERQSEQIQRHAAISTERLASYDIVLQGIEQQDPVLLKRLASAQLNLVPDSDTPVLLDASIANGSFDSWVDSSLHTDSGELDPYPKTLLAIVSTGPYRTVFIAGGIFCLFIGMISMNETTSPSGERSPA